MKKFYEVPEIEVTELSVEDILNGSNDDDNISNDEVIMNGDSLFD